MRDSSGRPFSPLVCVADLLSGRYGNTSALPPILKVEVRFQCKTAVPVMVSGRRSTPCF